VRVERCVLVACASVRLASGAQDDGSPDPGQQRTTSALSGCWWLPRPCSARPRRRDTLSGLANCPGTQERRPRSAGLPMGSGLAADALRGIWGATATSGIESSQSRARTQPVSWPSFPSIAHLAHLLLPVRNIVVHRTAARGTQGADPQAPSSRCLSLLSPTRSPRPSRRCRLSLTSHPAA